MICGVLFNFDCVNAVPVKSTKSHTPTRISLSVIFIETHSIPFKNSVGVTFIASNTLKSDSRVKLWPFSIRQYVKNSAKHAESLQVLASYLVNVPGATATVTGSASPDGTEGTTNEENNVKLSEQRAEAMKKVLLDYIKGLKVEDFDESRISTKGIGTGKANGVTGDSDPKVLSKYQNTEIWVTNPEFKKAKGK